MWMSIGGKITLIPMKTGTDINPFSPEPNGYAFMGCSMKMPWSI